MLDVYQVKNSFDQLEQSEKYTEPLSLASVY
jgi:hypothetical protein